MGKRGKNYRNAVAMVDRETFYEPRQALELAQQTAYTKFDPTIEVHIRLGVDPRQAEEQVRETVMFPHGLGKTVRIIAFAEGDDARLAEQSGAEHIVDDELTKKIQDGWTDFDAAVATPSMMGKVGRLGKILGPRGLMPNPKAGTVVPGEDLPRVIKELKAGRVEFRLDRTANLHVPIGKASFETDKLYENMAELMEVVKRAKPASSKGSYIRKIVLSNTMGPGVKVDANAAQAM